MPYKIFFREAEMKRKIEKFLKRICAKNAQKEITSWERILHRQLRPEEAYFIRKDWLSADDKHGFFPEIIM